GAGSGDVVSRRTRGRTFHLRLAWRASLTSSRRLADVPADRPARCLASHRFGIVSSMAGDNDPTREPTIFSAVLTPHRSLSRKGFLALMLVAGGISLGTGPTFLPPPPFPRFGFFR